MWNINIIIKNTDLVITLQPLFCKSYGDPRVMSVMLTGPYVFGNHDRQSSGGRLNKKDGLTRYGDSHVKDKTS